MTKRFLATQEQKIDVVTGFLCRPPYEMGGYPDTFMVVGDTYIFATCREDEPYIYHYQEQGLIEWYDRAADMAAQDGRNFAKFFNPGLYPYGPNDFSSDDWRVEYFWETEQLAERERR